MEKEIVFPVLADRPERFYLLRSTKDFQDDDEPTSYYIVRDHCIDLELNVLLTNNTAFTNKLYEVVFNFYNGDPEILDDIDNIYYNQYHEWALNVIPLFPFAAQISEDTFNLLFEKFMKNMYDMNGIEEMDDVDEFEDLE